MKMYRSFLCALLVLIMIFSFCACDRTGDGETDKASTVPTETAGEVSSTPSDETPAEPSSAVPDPSDPPENRPDLVILDWEEYENRPRGIQPGTVLNYAVSSVPDWSPLPWNISPEGWLVGNVYEGLLYMYMNDPTDIRGCIAETWSHSGDYLTWTFQIRDGVQFTDGTVCDADAIAKSWDYIKGVSPYIVTNYNIDSWEAASSGEFIVRLSAPCAWFEAVLCTPPFFIVSPIALNIYGTNDNNAAVGTGPYRIDSYAPGEKVVLVANPDYYLEEKMPCIQTANFIPIKELSKEKETILSALLEDKVDGAAFSDLFYYERLGVTGYDGNLAVSCGYDYGFSGASPLWFNANSVEAFRTLEVRKAICRFIDFNAVNDLVYDGLGRVQDSLWAKGSSGYVPTDQFYYNPDEGRELLASVGVEAADIKFDVIVGEKPSDVLASVQTELNQAGVKMGFETLGPDSSFSPLYGGRWTILSHILGYSNTAPYAPWLYSLEPDALIKTCWQDIYDTTLYEKMLSEYDAMTGSETWNEMLTHCRQLTTYVQDDFGAIGGVKPPAFVALGKDFKNGIFFLESHAIQLYYLYQ